MSVKVVNYRVRADGNLYTEIRLCVALAGDNVFLVGVAKGGHIGTLVYQVREKPVLDLQIGPCL